MKRITSNIVNDARKILSIWKRTSREVGKKVDKDFQLRECASSLGVDHEALKKRLGQS